MVVGLALSTLVVIAAIIIICKHKKENAV